MERPENQSFAADAYHHAEHVSRVLFAAFDTGGYGKGEDYTLIDLDHVCAFTTRKFTNSIPNRQKVKKRNVSDFEARNAKKWFNSLVRRDKKHEASR